MMIADKTTTDKPEQIDDAAVWEALRDVFAPPGAEEVQEEMLAAMKKITATTPQSDLLVYLTSSFVAAYLSKVFEDAFGTMTLGELFSEGEQNFSVRLRDVYLRRPR